MSVYANTRSRSAMLGLFFFCGVGHTFAIITIFQLYLPTFLIEMRYEGSVKKVEQIVHEKNFRVPEGNILHQRFRICWINHFQ